LFYGTVWYGILEFNVPLGTVGHFGDGFVLCTNLHSPWNW